MEKIIIYGYSSIGEAVYQECIRRNFLVLCFCEDNEIRKNKAIADVDVLSLEEIVQKEMNGKFIICIPNAEPVIKKLKNAGYMNWDLAVEYLIKEKYIQDTYTIKSKRIAIREIESCILAHKYLKMPEKFFLRNIDLEITEKCSLRCRDCSNLMQYYKVPKNYPVEELIFWVDSLLKYVDEIYEIRILGGEPFMHRDVHRVIEHLIKYPSIHRILIWSNATIMPTEEMWNIMENDKVGFSITNYGKLSRNLSDIQQELKKRDIVYDIHEVGDWTQCSNIVKHGRDEEALKKIYDDCCAKNLVTLLDGKIYKCPYMANAINLKAIPAIENEYIDLRELENMGLGKAKSILKKYLVSKEFFMACDYCEGRSFDAQEIEPAIQISEPRDYTIIGE